MLAPRALRWRRWPGEGMCSRSPVSSSGRVLTAATREGSWVRDPAWSIAAVREVDDPTANPPVAPAATFAAPKASRSRLGLVPYRPSF